MNENYEVEIELKAKVYILADSPEAAHAEAEQVAEDVRAAATRAGLFMEVRSVKPRRVLSKAEVT